MHWDATVQVLNRGDLIKHRTRREGNNYNDYQWVFGELGYQTDDKTVARTEYV